MCSGTPCTPCLEDLRKQWLTYQSAIIVFLSLSGTVATWPNFANEHAIICLDALLFLFNSTGGFTSGKTHRADCCFVSGLYWYTQVLSPFATSQTRGELPPSNFLSIWVHQSILPLFCSSLRLWGTRRTQRFLTPRQSRRMRVRLHGEIFVISCILACVIFGSLLIRDSTLETFSVVTGAAIRLQRSSSSNVLVPDMKCLNHLKIEALDGD